MGGGWGQVLLGNSLEDPGLDIVLTVFTLANEGELLFENLIRNMDSLSRKMYMNMLKIGLLGFADLTLIPGTTDLAWGPQTTTTSSCTTWEFVRKADAWAPPHICSSETQGLEICILTV